jgi:Ca2+-binding EF-hand superfamily protein
MSYNKKPAVSTQDKNKPKAVQVIPFKAEHYVNSSITLEEVNDIKTAFDIFDGDQSGFVDPQELKNAFISLGFGGQNKFVYQMLNDLDGDKSGGIDFG